LVRDGGIGSRDEIAKRRLESVLKSARKGTIYNKGGPFAAAKQGKKGERVREEEIRLEKETGLYEGTD